jgi:predicted enzyme related to lactoylglutathione lyase
MSRVIHFEIPADKPDRAAEFYSTVFGWQIQKWPGAQDYWLASTGPEGGPGINGGLLRRPHPGAATCNTIGVKSIAESLAKITKSGGKLVVPKMGIPGIGHLAYCSDTEGNIFGVMQADKSAS